MALKEINATRFQVPDGDFISSALSEGFFLWPIANSLAYIVSRTQISRASCIQALIAHEANTP